MSEQDVEARMGLSFKEYVAKLRTEHSKRPKTSGFKGVHQRGDRFEARISPYPVWHPL